MQLKSLLLYVLVTDTVLEVQRKILVLETFCDKWGMEVNLTKTQVIDFRNSGETSKSETFFYLAKKVKVVTYYRYLRLVFSTRNNWCKALLTLGAQAEKALKYIRTMFWKLGHPLCWVGCGPGGEGCMGRTFYLAYFFPVKPQACNAGGNCSNSNFILCKIVFVFLVTVNIVNSFSRPVVNIIVQCKGPSGLVTKLNLKKKSERGQPVPGHPTYIHRFLDGLFFDSISFSASCLCSL